jgi:hypothetical protein
MEALSPQEAACVYCRLGYLHVFNPTKPEGSWEFDLSRREERIIVKMLCILGIYEPGNNFLNETFRWARDLDPLGGWELVRSFFNPFSVLFDRFYKLFSFFLIRQTPG